MPAKKTRKISKAVRKKKEQEAIPSVLVDDENLDTIDRDPFINNYLLSWQAPEFVYHKKSAAWHIIVAIFVVILTGTAIFLREWIAVVVFLISGFLIFQYSEVKPHDIEIGLTTVGIKVGNSFYPYNKLKSFWLVYEPPVKTLNLETTKRFAPIISIQLEETDPFLVKNILKEHLLEEPERTEDLIDRLSRFLKF